VTTSTKLVSGDRVPSGSPALVPMVIGPCPLGTVGTTYAFDPGADVASTLGAGMVSEEVLYLLRETSARVLVTPSTGTWQTAPTLTHGGTGLALISLALSGGNALGCYDDHSIAIIVVAGGTALTGARVSISYDGTTVAETINIPAENPAVVRSTVDLNAQSYAWAALNATTVIFTAPASKTLTFASAPTSAQNVIDALNALAIAAPLAVTFRLAQNAAGNAFVEMVSTATGAAAAITLGAGTANSLLGLTAATTNGSAATYPGPAVGPRSSLLSVHAAAVAARNQIATNPFGFVVVAQPADTAPNCAAMVADLETLRATWLADATAPTDVYFMVAAPWHTPSATQATNETNVAAADAALVTAFAGQAASLNTVTNGDCYVAGALRIGSFRRPGVIAAAVKRAGAAYLAQDLADGSIPEVSLLAPDGITRARNENTATTKLGALDGPGFSVMRTMADGRSVKFVPGATRAGATSRLRNIGDVAVANEIARVVQAVTEAWDGQRPPVDATGGAGNGALPATFGMMTAAEKQSRADQVDAVIRPILKPDVGKWNCSDFAVVVTDPATGRFLDNGKTPVKVSYIPLGEITSVDITIAVTGTSLSG
jgi:hypothetical protein